MDILMQQIVLASLLMNILISLKISSPDEIIISNDERTTKYQIVAEASIFLGKLALM